jgi:hypothetical protein
MMDPHNREFWDSVNIVTYGFDGRTHIIYYRLEWSPFAMVRDDNLCQDRLSFQGRSYDRIIREWRAAVKRYRGSGEIIDVQTSSAPYEAFAGEFVRKIRSQILQISKLFPGSATSRKRIRAEEIRQNATIDFQTAVAKASRKLSLDDLVRVVNVEYVARIMDQ